MRNYILLTGATGLLGQYLTRDMLDGGERVAVLVRPTKRQTAVERVEQYMQMWERERGHALKRPIVISGDITKEDLGLTAEDREWVSENCTTMLHCAASLTFHEYRGEPYRTNVDGTKHVLKLCVDCDISEMHYISTAYVCGKREDLVKEDDLDVKQEFRNVYEESKFVAEGLVRDCPAFSSLTVYRPVVITGDGNTGYTSTYHGSYLYMRLAKLLAQRVPVNEEGFHHVPVRWGLTGKERRNITTVDWNSTIICNLIANREAHGKTFHLAPCDPISMKDAIEYGTKFYGLTGIEFRGYGEKADHPRNELERWLWSNIEIYGSYDFMDPQFDTTNLEKYAATPVCPRLDWEMANRLMNYAEDDRWGKRKKNPGEAAPFAAIEELPSHVAADAVNAESAFGVDILGPGGAPVTLTIDASGKLAGFRRGLPSHEDTKPQISVTTEQLSAIKSEGGDVIEYLTKQLSQTSSSA